MKKYTTTIIIIAISLILGLVTGLLYNGNSTDKHAGHEHETTVETATEWTCSMHPSIRQPEFGDCPICGMDLIPLEHDDSESLDPDGVRMSEAALALADIRTDIVRTGPVVKHLTLNGTLVADERRIEVLSSHISGRIEDLTLDFTGQYVQKGDVIAEIYSPELVTAQKELFEALKNETSMPQLVTAAKEKLKNWKLNDAQIAEIIASGTPLNRLQVLADRSGYVTGKRVHRGDYIKQGQALYEVSDLSQLWMLLDIYEKDIAWIEPGDSVRIHLPSLPGKRFTGTIDYIDPVLNTVTRVAKARVNLSNSDGRLKPGMYGTGIVFSGLEGYKDLPVIPASAVMWTGKRSLVYVRQHNETGIDFTMRNVTLGPKLDDSYVVTGGLDLGENIAVNGTFSIDAAAQLSGKRSMMNVEGEAFQSTHDHGSMTMNVETNVVEDHAVMDMGSSHRTVELSKEAGTALAGVYDAYFDLKDALVADKAKKAKTDLLRLKKELETIDMSLFNGDAHAPFMESRDMILMHIPEKKKLSDIERLRSAFEYVSDGMIDLTRTFTPTDKIIYVQYCPMAFNDKGADWISRDADIKNPYFGASMLTCGDVTDTLKAKK